jgi:hypothetical protein
VRLLGTLTLVAVVLAACHDDATPPRAASAASSDVSAPTFSAPPSTLPSPAEMHLTALLLTPDALGVTFTNAQLGPPTDTALPCGQPDPRSVVHPQARVVGLLADYLDGLGVAENLSQFASVDDAAQVMSLSRDGVSCGTGTIDNASGSTTIVLSPVQDVTTQVDADEAFAVVVDLGDGSNLTTIAARVNDLVVVFQIGSKAKANLDPLQTAKQGVDKIRAG